MFSLRLLTISLIIIFSYSIQAQTYNLYETKKDIELDGSETNDFTNTEVIVKNTTDRFNPVYGDFFTYNIYNITDRKTGYDIQSNASSQQVWYDLNSDFMHSVFTNSEQTISWSDRTSLYFGSTDMGVNWFELGPVPPNTGSFGRSGFTAIYGTSTGRAAITNHNNSEGTTTHTKVFVDNTPFEYNFTTYDPGDVAQGTPIWPRLVVNQNDDVLIASSTNNPPYNCFTNLLDLPVGIFSGYSSFDCDGAEQYAFSISNSGKIGMAFNGSAQTNDDGDVYYTESTDGGINWSFPIKIFDRPDGMNISLGAMRGVSCSFYGEMPCVVFEIIQQDFLAGTYFPNLPNNILFWSPAVNGGIVKIIADSTNVPFAPSLGTNDVMAPYCRPVIGRSETGNFLFTAFNVATDEVYPSADTTSYFAGYLMISSDGGNTWSVPEKFTPSSPPPYDWRYISIAPINPVDGGFCTVHMVVQGDTIPGSTINAIGMPVGVTAQYYHISTNPIAIPVELISFTASIFENNVTLNWKTASESNNQGFEVQRKIIDNEIKAEWVAIGYREGAGTTTEPQEYSYYDDILKINATAFNYRLKQVDYDGSFEFSEEITVENSTALPTEIKLAQNYPNPFNPSTTIKFSLPSSGYASIKIYNALGEEITVLLDNELAAGTYEVEWNARGLPSGVYFYKLQAGSFVETKKMLLLK